MKKVLTSLLALALTLSLVGCSENTNTDTSGDTSTNKEKVVVEITNENWQEYFEITYEYEINLDSFDTAEDYTSKTYLSLKDEYTLVDNNSEIAFECKGDIIMYNVISYDLETSNLELGDVRETVPGEADDSGKAKLSDGKILLGSTGSIDSLDYVAVKNVNEISRIKGTITIYK